MKLSEAIAMVEDWLDENTYNYCITSVEFKAESLLPKEGTCKITFEEYGPEGFESQTFFTVPPNERRIYNFNGYDVLEFGRENVGNDKAWNEWFDEFEKKWRYGDA